jgi:hypothetical protein
MIKILRSNRDKILSQINHINYFVYLLMRIIANSELLNNYLITFNYVAVSKLHRKTCKIFIRAKLLIN